jgi:hypothetical protein
MQYEQGVIRVLDDGTWEVICKGVQQAIIANFLHQQASKKLGDRKEEVGGKMVPLTKAILQVIQRPATPFSKTGVFPGQSTHITWNRTRAHGGPHRGPPS